MSSTEEEILQKYRVRRTVMEMLNVRGYNVSDDEINMTLDQFQERYGDNMNSDNLFISKEMRNNSSDKIYVFFVATTPSKKTVGIPEVKQFLVKMTTDLVFRAILVVAGKLTPYANKALLEEPKLTLEVFEEAELLVNVMKHALVPEHQVLTDDEKKALLEKYQLHETKLPRILVNDPVARHFGLKRGQVMKIIRPSENAGKYITYRIVF
ncbi:DNA-directed RNA polymerases II and IV subunit 5A-like [Silene latifolia]|uniref:DNA-directed RNA polymerases II and IV subunit 5A-like n=1 Tax=Silene latifolia TaxID=37657 RepID=UPI003D789D79